MHAGATFFLHVQNFTIHKTDEIMNFFCTPFNPPAKEKGVFK
jgi:hypothetical protein